MNDTPEARAERILAFEAPRLTALVAQAIALVDSKAPAGHKFTRIVQIADGLNRAIAPHVVCKNGCSHCCYMATSINGLEARAIARFTGRKAQRLGRQGVAHPGLTNELRARFTQVACTFLADGKCTIYPVRPIACRLHHSLEASPDPCDITKGPGHHVGQLNLGPIISIVAQLFLTEDYGDIREFFPPENP